MTIPISIKHRHFIIMGTIALGLLIIYLIQYNATAKLDQLSKSQLMLSKIESQMLMLRRHEKDFIARKDVKYLQKFTLSHNEKSTKITDLKQLLEASDIDSSLLKSLEHSNNQYYELFKQFVKTQNTIGIDHESGLYGELRAAVHGVESVIKTQPELLAGMLTLRRNEKDFMLRRTDKYIDKFHKNVDVFKQQILDDQKLGNSQRSKIITLLAQYQQEFTNLSNAEKTLGLDHKTGIHGSMRKTIKDTEAIFQQLSEELTTNLVSTQQTYTAMFNVIFALTAVVIILIVFMTSISIYRPLERFSKTIVNMASNHDLSQRLDYQGKDELQQLSQSLNSLLTLIQTTLQQVKTMSSELSNTAESMHMTASDVRTATARQATEVEMASTAIHEMSATAQEIASNAVNAADRVSDTNEGLNVGVQHTQDTKTAIENLMSDSQHAASSLATLQDNSSNIGQVLANILGIAEQTNLLALNAAIEAARAGEQGRGFAVVADEVRTLAQRTQDATVTIQETVNRVHQGTEQVVGTVQKSYERAEESLSRAEAAVSALSDISKQVAQINDMNTQVATAAEEQTAVTAEISQNVVNVADLSKTVSEQANITETHSEQLSRLSKDIDTQIAQFKI